MPSSFAFPPLGLIRSTMRCALEDDALTGLREMQKVLRTRRSDLRSRGVYGKADDKEKSLTVMPDADVQLDSLPAHPHSQTTTDPSNHFSSDIAVALQDSVISPLRRAISQPSFSLTRRESSLPWVTSVEKRPEPPSFEVVPIFNLGDLTDFTYQRADPSLPRREALVLRELERADFGNVDNCSTLLDRLNECQRRAVLVNSDLACLVLAGPGSGKTRVLTHRIAYLVQQRHVSPFKILAVTFTNKAAQEMKARVAHLLFPVEANETTAKSLLNKMAIGTFHSIAVRFLRKYGAEIGIRQDFDICDSSDSRAVLVRVLKAANGGQTPESAVVGQTRTMISTLKNQSGVSLKERMRPFQYKRICELREMYDAELQKMNVLDFDDLLLETRRLFTDRPEVLKELQDRFENVLIDEWQDTNEVQFDIASMLANRRRNLFVVGDADQSIYKFRGADNGNMYKFLRTFPDAVQVALEENYRSSGCIVEAAQFVINKDKKRPKKSMTTRNAFGDKIVLSETVNEYAEAKFVTHELHKLRKFGQLGSFSDAAVLYRTNAQSRQLEEAFRQSSIPYRLQSGVRFYDRKEVKDLVGYLRLIANPADDNAFRRVVNTPSRGMGPRTLAVIEEFARRENVPLFKAVSEMIQMYQKQEESHSLRASAIQSIGQFYNLLYRFRNEARSLCALDSASLEERNTEESNKTNFAHVGELLAFMIEEIHYREFLNKRKEDEPGSAENTMQRQANVDELIKGASKHESLREFLENVALFSNTGHLSLATGPGAVSLMTLHSGKGLEYRAVFVVGAEDGVIPMMMMGAGNETEAHIDEERRLLYVGMTRAKKFLYITWRKCKHTIFGKRVQRKDSGKLSRFLDAIPPKCVTQKSSQNPV